MVQQLTSIYPHFDFPFFVLCFVILPPARCKSFYYRYHLLSMIMTVTYFIVYTPAMHKTPSQ